MALGRESDKQEGTTMAPDDVIPAKDRDSPRRITNAIMKEALSGKIYLAISALQFLRHMKMSIFRF